MKEIKRIVEQVTAAFDRLNKHHAGARLLQGAQLFGDALLLRLSREPNF